MRETGWECAEGGSGLEERAPALDLDALDANTMGDLALQRELFDLYFGFARDAAARLRGAAAARAAKEWVAAAHGLKGTARTLGLIRLADVTAAAQAAGEAADVPSEDAFGAMLSQIEDALLEATAAAHAYLGQVIAKAS